MKTRAQWSLVLILLLSLCVPGTVRAAETVADSYSTARTTTLAIAAPGILANDDCTACVVASVDGTFFEGQISFGPTPPGGDPQPPLASGSGASLTAHSDGSFTYDGSAVPSGVNTDSFTYQAQDDRGLSTTATVTITLTEPPANFAPEANDDLYSVELGSVLTVPAPGLLGNDTDADGDALSVSLVNGVAPTFNSPVALSQGDLTIQADGSFTYSPNPGAVAGTDESFTYSATDGTDPSNSATVGISLTESPTGDTVVRVTFDDVGFVTVDAEIGLSGLDQLDVGAASGTLAQVGGGGLPPQTGALVLRNSAAAYASDARELFKGCERMALVAQAQPTKYDLVVEIHSATPATTFSQGGDGEVIVDVAETRVTCWTARATTTAPAR
jgi:hypothetical protein